MNKMLCGVVASVVALGAMVGCGSGSGSGDLLVKEDQFGKLSLSLTGSDNQGQQYRLRDASFQIYGYDYYYGYPYPYPGYGGAASVDGGAAESNVQTVSSETDPDAPVISTRVVPGYYTVTLLNDNWHLEKVTPNGPEVVAESVLLSERSQYAYVYDRGVSDVVFRFGVDGKLIDFRHGNIDIGIEIEHPGDCGDGVINGTEQCDGSELGGQTCNSVTLGALPNGTLACNGACGFDLSGCTGWGGTGGFVGAGGFPSAFDAGVGTAGAAAK